MLSNAVLLDIWSRNKLKVVKIYRYPSADQLIVECLSECLQEVTRFVLRRFSARLFVFSQCLKMGANDERELSLNVLSSIYIIL